MDSKVTLINNSQVTFFEDTHKYITTDFRELSGITAIIKKCICPNLYADVDDATLSKAAAHGTLCHKLCEAWDNGELNLEDDGNYTAMNDIVRYEGSTSINLVDAGHYITDPELHEYINLVTKHNLNIEASEYLISDDHFASCIDKVIRESDNEFSILDLKFTYAYHEEPVTWQCSFYADMFEKQNPNAKVKHLYCIHIHVYRDAKGKIKSIKSHLHELKRVKTELLNECKRCFRTGEEFYNPLAKLTLDTSVDEGSTFAIDYNGQQLSYEDIAEFWSFAAEVEAKKKTITNSFKSWFADNPTYNKVSSRLFTISQSAPYTTETIDTTKLKAEYPEAYNACCITKKVASHPIFKLKNK